MIILKCLEHVRSLPFADADFYPSEFPPTGWRRASAWGRLYFGCYSLQVAEQPQLPSGSSKEICCRLWCRFVPQKRRADRLRSAFGLVRRRGLEPLCLAALAPQASASANFATSALNPAYECGEAVSNPKISIPSVGGIARLRVALGCSVRYGNRPRIKCRNTERDSRGSLAWIRTCAASFLRLRNCECWDVLTQVFWDEGR